MIDQQNFKVVSVTPPAAIIDDAAVVTAFIDTAGFDYCNIFVYSGATDIAMVSLAVQESDVSGSGYANVPGLIWGTSTNIDGDVSGVPTALDDNLHQVAQVDLLGRKRYLDVSCVMGDGSAGGFIAIHALLSRAGESPVTVAQMGCNEVLRV